MVEENKEKKRVVAGVVIAWVLVLALVIGLSWQHNGYEANNGNSIEPSTQSIHLDYEINWPIAPQPAGIIFSTPAGLYLSSFYLEIESDIEGAVIYFTLDGSVPVFGESYLFDRPLYISNRTPEENVLSAIPGDRIGCFIVYFQDYFTPPVEPVFKATVVRVRAFDENGNSLTEVFTNSYFVSPDIFERYAGLPIVSLVTNADYFFDDEIGIYVRGHNNTGGHGPGDPMPNWEQRGREWERPAHMELFEVDSHAHEWERAVAMDLGIRIHGGDSRRLAQKSLRLYARSYYDPLQSRIRHDVFNGRAIDSMGEPITDFSRLLLRNAGNEGTGSMFRCAGTQFLSRYLNLGTQAARPAVVFLNGEFWGLYNIRERFDEWYVASHYGVSRHDVAILDVRPGPRIEISVGSERDYRDFRELEAFIEANSFEDDINLRFVQRYMDTDSFMDAHIANIFFGNMDWPGNNMRFWRYNGTLDPELPGHDGRWRWLLIDLDSTTGFSFGFDYNEDSLFRLLVVPEERQAMDGDFAVSPRSSVIFRRLMENEGFRTDFVNRFADLMNTYFAQGPFLDMIETFSENIRPVMPEQIARYGRINSMGDWERELEVLWAFANNRQEYMFAFLAGNLGLREMVNVSTAINPSHGRIAINGILLDPEITPGVVSAASFNGVYFAGMIQTFNAIPHDGYLFERFVVTSSTDTTMHTANPLKIEITEDTIVEAIFTSSP